MLEPVQSLLGTRTAIGLLGGTFDPFHAGHLALALSLYAQLPLQEIRLIPCAQPLLRNPAIATAQQRLAMVKIAIENYPYLIADDQEIKRPGFSYTIDTLLSLRKELPNAPLCLIMSADQFIQFDRWQSWEHIPELAHLIIANRPSYPLILNSTIQTLVDKRHRDDVRLLLEKPAGFIFFQPVAPLMVSGTDIRARLKAGMDIQQLVPEKIKKYIRAQNLYC